MIKSTTFVAGSTPYLHLTKGRAVITEGLTLNVEEAVKAFEVLKIFIQANKNIEQRQRMLNFVVDKPEVH